MAQPQQESSLLFSLAELRQIEDERIAAEEADRVAAIEAEREATEAAERQAQLDAIEKQRCAEQRARQAIENEAAERRAETLRLEEAERAARIEADAQIAQIRLAKEMELRRIEAENKRPVGLKLLAGALVIIAIGLGLVVYSKVQDNQRAEEQLAQTKAEIAAIQKRINTLITEKERAYEAKLAAKTEADEAAAAARVAEIEAEIAERNAALARIENRRRPPRRPPRGETTTTTDERIEIVPSGCTADQPLCGLDKP